MDKRVTKMEIEVHHTVPFDELTELQAREIVVAACQVQKIPDDFSLSIVIVDDATIQKMNKEYRGKDMPTDVLSFPYDDSTGEIVLSADRIRAQAHEFGHSVECEASFMLIHGILHVMGWDHERSKEEAREQRTLEHTILDICGLQYAR